MTAKTLTVAIMAAVILAAAMIAAGADHKRSMRLCMEKHSFETCRATLN